MWWHFQHCNAAADKKKPGNSTEAESGQQEAKSTKANIHRSNKWIVSTAAMPPSNAIHHMDLASPTWPPCDGEKGRPPRVRMRFRRIKSASGWPMFISVAFFSNNWGQWDLLPCWSCKQITYWCFISCSTVRTPSLCSIELATIKYLFNCAFVMMVFYLLFKQFLTIEAICYLYMHKQASPPTFI